MHAAMMDIAQMDVFIGAAAVADYRVAEPAVQKIKKTAAADTLTLTLVKNPDIIHSVAQRSPKPFVVGFAAETEQLRHYASQKRMAKGMDLICANQVGENLGFDQPDNAITAIWAGGEQVFERSDKAVLATQLIELMNKIIEQG
jgi:phosphopantothenoylcysteine decarboxylase/phosphopantothenate--cysteine ligase